MAADQKAKSSPGAATVYRGMRVGVIVATIIVLFGALTPSGSLPGKDFYTLAAQIFPLLLLALAIEAGPEFWADVSSDLHRKIIGTLVAGEIVAVVALSGTIAADSGKYDDYAGRDDIFGAKFFAEPDIERVIEDGPLVAWSYYPSLVFATVTALALAWTLVGVVVIARARVSRASPPAKTKPPPESAR